MKRQLFRLLRWLQRQCDNHPDAPQWCTPTEMFDHLIFKGYDRTVAEELSVQYAGNLQRSYGKGWSMGYRKASIDYGGLMHLHQLDEQKRENAALRQRLAALG